ncbi:MAG: alkaline phosphatase [Emcibacter sp.]|nr:alkaline phosphatase [Emcibacter sp.]
MAEKLAQKPITKPAKNVILFIGDGMGPSTVTATRILAGQLQGQSGEENILSWETFPYAALSKTYNTNQQVADSAGTASAFLSGAKTKAGVISVNQSVARGDCRGSLNNHMDTILELSERSGLNTGIVTTARLTHATPAAAYAHSPERNWENDGQIPSSEKQYGCKDIAQQFMDFSVGDGIEVAFGGGRSNFLPTFVRDQEGQNGKRKDGRNLVSEWITDHKDGQYVWNQKTFDGLDIEGDGPILGLFNASHMEYEADRENDRGGEPSLAQMTQKALQILTNKGGGYFLYIEGARIDHAHHKGNAYKALHGGVALADAVQMAIDMTDREDTLIIVTADHSHGFVMTGYATRGNPILGKVVENDARGQAKDHAALGYDNLPYTTVGYYSGPGAIQPESWSVVPRSDLTNIDTEAKDYIQQAVVPHRSETHGGEDVAIYADGPAAYLFQGVVEQNYIFHVMHHALRLGDELK